MDVHILTLFPEMFTTPLQASILQRAQERCLLQVHIHNLRDFTTDRHRITDDAPYGGGAGMIMKPEPIVTGVRQIKARFGPAYVILLSPQGVVLTQDLAKTLAQRQRLLLICGRYGGVDARVQAYTDAEISIGDYVLTGGEFPALVLLDVVGRLLPGVLGDRHSLEDDSLFHGILQGPQYTRPVEFDGARVPEALLSGNHAAITQWRRRQALWTTFQRRPDLLRRAVLTPQDQAILQDFSKQEQSRMASDFPRLFVALLHFPVYNKTREVVATSLTTLNLHDLGRLTVTYGAAGCYVVTPLQRQRALAQQMLAHWTRGYGATYNPTRATALQDMQVVEHLAAVEQDIVQRCGVAPKMIATDARTFPQCIAYTALRQIIWQQREVFLLLLGTGWGLAEEVITRCEYILAPIYGLTSYNHLPVRVAAGIMLDRLLGHAEAEACWSSLRTSQEKGPE